MPTSMYRLKNESIVQQPLQDNHLSVVRNDAASIKAERSNFLDQLSFNSLIV